MEIIIKGKQHLRLSLLVGCGQLHLLSKHIAGSFDYQYHWNKTSNLLDFLHDDSHQVKVVASGTTSFDRVWLVVLLLQTNCKIFLSPISLERIKSYLKIFVWSCHEGKAASETTTFGWVQQVVPFVQDSLIINTEIPTFTNQMRRKADSSLLWGSISWEPWVTIISALVLYWQVYWSPKSLTVLMSLTIWESHKIFVTLHSTPCDNYF